MARPYSPSCERNREPILAVLRRAFAGATRVLEIGSGTGQHAVYFAPALPHLVWQPSDLPERLAGIRAWLAAHPAANLRPPIALDVDGPWPATPFDGFFSANTCHILAWPSVVNLIAGAARTAAPGAVLCLYGPFRYGGRHTSESNARFDASLRAQAPQQGVREVGDLIAVAAAAGFLLYADHEMPANNRLLEFRRRPLRG